MTTIVTVALARCRHVYRTYKLTCDLCDPVFGDMRERERERERVSAKEKEPEKDSAGLVKGEHWIVLVPLSLSLLLSQQIGKIDARLNLQDNTCNNNTKKKKKKKHRSGHWNCIWDEVRVRYQAGKHSITWARARFWMAHLLTRQLEEACNINIMSP